MRVEVRSVAPDGNLYMLLNSIFKAGIDGEIAKIKYLRQAGRFLPDNIYTALDNLRAGACTKEILGEDVKDRYVGLKQASIDRCPRALGTYVKAPKFGTTSRPATSSSGTSSKRKSPS